MYSSRGLSRTRVSYIDELPPWLSFLAAVSRLYRRGGCHVCPGLRPKIVPRDGSKCLKPRVLKAMTHIRSENIGIVFGEKTDGGGRLGWSTPIRQAYHGERRGSRDMIVGVTFGVLWPFLGPCVERIP